MTRSIVQISSGHYGLRRFTHIADARAKSPDGLFHDHRTTCPSTSNSRLTGQLRVSECSFDVTLIGIVSVGTMQGRATARRELRL
ncbi:MAG TPA: hypothetical protein VMU99_10560 [Acidimicrobiales bacterium]|nr:hypothetical protein [Acidimicrobiales bacterium]